jgi:hypothetical protein
MLKSLQGVIEMMNTPHDLARHIKTVNIAMCDRCSNTAEIEGERSRYSVAEYLIKKGWSASDDEIVCDKHAQSALTISAQSAVGGSSE